MSKNFFFFSLVVLTFILSASLAAAAPWTPPPAEPPACPDGSHQGCNPPINTSATGQTKLGALIAGGLRSLTNLLIGDGTNVTTLQNNDTMTVISKRSSDQALIDINPEPVAGKGAFVRFFRTTNTLGTRWVDFHKGDGTSFVDSRIGVGGLNSFFNISGGNVGFGTIFPASKVDVAGDICWTPLGGSRRCLGNFDPGGSGGGGGGGGGGGSGDGFWEDNQTGDIRNTNPSGQVNIKGQIKIEQGAPGNNKILISSNNAGLARWAAASEIPGVTGIGNDILHTTFKGCAALFGCPLRFGDEGPTVQPVIVNVDTGTLRMSCPAGYKVVSGGAECNEPGGTGFVIRVAYLNTSRPTNKTTWEVQCTQMWGTYYGLFQDRTFNAMKEASITCAK